MTLDRTKPVGLYSAQELAAALMLQGRFKNFDPDQVLADLDAPRELWVSFLAKGTLLVDKSLTKTQGYDLILDRSSIKGVDKAALEQQLPCGDYGDKPIALKRMEIADLLERLDELQEELEFLAKNRSQSLSQSHRRVRAITKE